MPHGPTPEQPPREVIEAVLDIAIFMTQDGREAVLAQLRPEMTSAIRRMPTARMDTISIVSTCARYPGGLTELADAIRFLAAGTTAMTHLDALLAQHHPDPSNPA